MQPFELRGHGVLLSVLTDADVDDVTEACQDPELERWITSINAPYTREQAAHFIDEVVPASWADESELIWGVRDPEDRRLLGTISIRPAQNQKKGEIGFWLVRDARGRGVSSRAVRLVAEYAFDDEGLGLTHLRWRAIVGNWASRRVAWATGFRVEGTLRGELTKQGRPRDAWVGTLTAGEAMKPATPWFDVPTLHGDAMLLRPFDESDAEAIVEACADPVSQHWLGALPSPYTREHALGYVHSRREDAAAGRGVHFAAALSEDGPARGAFSLMALNTHDGGAEIGYWVHPEARGEGLATRAVRLLAGHAFAERDRGGLGLRRLVVAHLTGNDASRKVIERSGFRPYGVERAGDRLRGGTVVDLHWYDRLLDDR